MNEQDKEDSKIDEDQALALRLLCSAISLKSRLYDFGEVPE
jgi:hypothetical protein